MSSKETITLVYKFLQDSNRPWSANDISEKCGKDTGKSAIQKALDSLVGKDKVVEKLFGKQKIYLIKQEDSKSSNTTEIAQLEKQLSNLQAELKVKEDKIIKMEGELKKLGKQLSISDLEKERTTLKEIIANCTKILENYSKESSQKTSKLSSEDIKKIETNHEKLLTGFRKRKRMCNDMIDAIMEGYPKSKKQLIEEVGIESDESVGFKLIN